MNPIITANMKLVFATHNNNKLEEIKQLLPPSIELVSLTDIGCAEDIPETAETLQGNAQLKADFITKKYGLNSFADDTGLEVAALNGQPGVYSARYAGQRKSSEANMQKLLDNLENEESRDAQFRTVIALNLNGDIRFFEGICHGEITREKKGEKGFGYDPVFRPTGFQKTFAEMSMIEKSTLSHRGLAFQKLISFLAE